MLGRTTAEIRTVSPSDKTTESLSRRISDTGRKTETRQDEVTPEPSKDEADIIAIPFDNA